METITIPKAEYIDLIGLYLKIKQRLKIITKDKSEDDLLKEFYDIKLKISEEAFSKGEIIEHNDLKNEIEQWKKARK